jgi:hypothetical protein
MATTRKAYMSDKLLVIFDLNGVLGYVNKNVKTFNQYGIYNSSSEGGATSGGGTFAIPG